MDQINGTIIDERFRIDGELGRGGMGVVYRAFHLQMDKPIALKILQPPADEELIWRERFLREIKAASSVNHPNIVHVLASGITADHRPYVAMELIEGTSLAKVLEAEGKLSLERAERILIDVAAALAEAHSHNIMHRDIKPSNVMIARDADGNEKAMLIDFGLAKEVAESQGQTRTIMQGTPLYMSPEQCSEQRTDPRTDVYSFGCLMFEMLSGKPPFNAESPYEVLYKHLHETVPRLPSEIPAYLSNIVHRCLQKDRNTRYANGMELLEALSTRSASSVKLKKGQRRRKKSHHIAIGLMVLLLVSTLAVFAEIPNHVEVACKIAETLDACKLYDAEAALYYQTVERFRQTHRLPKPDDRSARDIPESEQRGLLTYIDLRMKQAEAQMKARPTENFFARELVGTFADTFRPDKGGNVWMSLPVYDETLYRICQFALRTKDDAWERKYGDQLNRLGEQASSRSGATFKLAEPSVGVLKLGFQHGSRGDTTKIPRNQVSACYWLALADWHLAYVEHGPMRDKHIDEAEYYLRELLKERREHGYGGCEIGQRLQEISWCDRLRGKIEEADKELDEAIRVWKSERHPDVEAAFWTIEDIKRNAIAVGVPELGPAIVKKYGLHLTR